MASNEPTAPKLPRRSTGSGHRSTMSMQRTEVKINVYDLLPPGKLSTVLWTLGGSLLHSGVVIRDREYAYGGHDRQGVTGVYWTRPRLEPPGGTFRLTLTIGLTYLTDPELNNLISHASTTFPGPSYNLLTNNCNHFTSYLCRALTNHPAPSWLNRAASIGVALPCVVPKEWIAPPDADSYEDAEGWEEEGDESSGMMGRHSYDDRGQSQGGARAGRLSFSGERDSSGRRIPPSERAPVPG